MRDVANARPRHICLVSCSAQKSTRRGQARNLYTSPLFKLAARWADRFSADWFILSAKHGLLRPDDTISPYDTSLATFSPTARRRWTLRILESIEACVNPDDHITILAGSKYSGLLVEPLRVRGNLVVTPLRHMAIGSRMRWLRHTLEVSSDIVTLEAFYSLLWQLASFQNGPVPLSILSRQQLPDRGVYFFLEHGEHRADITQRRVVRVGTHAVSAGSSATLWSRLKTHRGLLDGRGSHRSSIFRTHIGRAIASRDRIESDYPHWGDQSVRDPSVAVGEVNLEASVSSHLSNMSVVWLAIDDTAGPHSDRAYIERNSIALLSQAGAALDTPSNSWLGHFAGRPEIESSGLWNINCVGDFPHPQFINVFHRYVRMDLGLLSRAPGPHAPAGWRSDARRGNAQHGFNWS